MGLVEVAFVALCLNASCIEEENYGEYQTLRRKQLNALAESLKYETLTVTTLKNDRLSGYDQNQTGIYGTGVAFDLLQILQQKFHFNYTVVTPQDNIWGATDTGVLEMLESNKADLSVAFLPVLPEYTTKITYSPSLDTGEWVVLMRRPEASATGSGLLAPFTLPVWLLILLSLVVVGPVIHFIIYLQHRLCTNEDEKIFPLPACIWFVYGALLKQGTTLNPMSDSSRLLFATWWIFITILTAFYTANLTAFLTLSKFTLPITEPKDIGAKRYKWVTTKGNALQDTMDDPQTRNLLGDPVDYLDIVDSIILSDEVASKNYMFIREKPIVEYVMYENYKEKTRSNVDEPKRCTFVITKFSVATFSRAFAYARNFKYKLLFDSAIQYLVESGIVKFKLREELPDTEICPHNLGNKERQLLNSDLKMTYEIVGGGFIISAVVFLIELCLHRVKKRNGNGKQTTVKNWVQNVNKHKFQINPNNNYEKFGYFGGGSTFITPPPSYNTLFNPRRDENIKKKKINGREYWVFGNNGGETKMIPLRTPSALLFQYTN